MSRNTAPELALVTLINRHPGQAREQRGPFVVSELKGLLAIVNLCIAEAEQRIAQQRQRIDELKANGQPTVEGEKTLDVMLAVAASMKDNQAIIQLQLSDFTLH
jgi:hypothetical protein